MVLVQAFLGVCVWGGGGKVVSFRTVQIQDQTTRSVQSDLNLYCVQKVSGTRLEAKESKIVLGLAVNISNKFKATSLIRYRCFGINSKIRYAEISLFVVHVSGIQQLENTSERHLRIPD